MTYYTDTTILGGLPVTIGWVYSPAEPDVGIMSGGIDDWWIEKVNGVKKKAGWLYKRIDRDEEDRIIQACLDDRKLWEKYGE